MGMMIISIFVLVIAVIYNVFLLYRFVYLDCKQKGNNVGYIWMWMLILFIVSPLLGCLLYYLSCSMNDTKVELSNYRKIWVRYGWSILIIVLAVIGIFAGFGSLFS